MRKRLAGGIYSASRGAQSPAMRATMTSAVLGWKSSTFKAAQDQHLCRRIPNSFAGSVAADRFFGSHIDWGEEGEENLRTRRTQV